MHLVLRQSFRTLFYKASVPSVEEDCKIEAKKELSYLFITDTILAAKSSPRFTPSI